MVFSNVAVLPAIENGAHAATGELEVPARVESKNSVKIPGCAYHLGMRRARHFSIIAMIACFFTSGLAGFKFWLAREGEHKAARTVLKDTGEQVAKALKLQMERDLASLDSIANLWHLDSQMTRPHFRKYVLSNYFKPNLESFETIILIHRIPAAQRAEHENEASAVETRRQCCNGTTYDEAGSICRARAKAQCKIKGPHRYYFTEVVHKEDGSRSVIPASHNKSEYLIVYNQEPWEKNPGPMGLDMFSLPSRREAFWESDRTGLKGMTKRMVRVFASVPEFGLLVWNNVFVDMKVDSNKTISQGVHLMCKKQILAKGGKPFSIGSVVSVYKPQTMFSNAISKVFGRELAFTQLFLFDERPDTKERQRLLAMYDPVMDEVDTNAEAMRLSEKTKAELTSKDNVQINSFKVGGTNTSFSVAVVPTEEFMAGHVTEFPFLILALSLLLALFSQMERWIGHPFIMSRSSLLREEIADEIRADLEADIQRRAEEAAKVQESIEMLEPYKAN